MQADDRLRFEEGLASSGPSPRRELARGDSGVTACPRRSRWYLVNPRATAQCGLADSCAGTEVPSCAIVRIDGDIVVGEITRPDCGAFVPFSQVDGDGNLGLRQDLARPLLVHVERRAASHQFQIV